MPDLYGSCSKELQHQVYQKICPVHMAHMRCAAYSQCSPPAVVQAGRMHVYRQKSQHGYLFLTTEPRLTLAYNIIQYTV